MIKLPRLLPAIFGASLLIIGYARASSNDTIDSSNAATKEIMQSIFQSIAEVLPLSMNEEEFKKTENRAIVTKNLEILRKNAGKLGAHTVALNRDYRYASKSLARDVRDISRKYESGRFSEASYLLGHVTENCITCHSKLGPKTPFDASTFFAKVDRKKIPREEFASLQVALRQFNDAAKTYEEIFNDPAVEPSEFMLSGALTDYLLLCIRVLNEPKRAQAQFAKILARKGIPEFLAHDLRVWSKRLSIVPSEKLVGDQLAQGKKIMSNAKNLMEFPMDRQAFVDYAFASAKLHKYLIDSRPSDKKSAEAFYYLGVTESVIGRSYWISETEYYLESAIRLNPSAPFARRAFAMLEEHALLEYSGSSGTHIPEDVQDDLRGLRALLPPQ